MYKEEQDAERRLNDVRQRHSEELQETVDRFSIEKERLAISSRLMRERAVDDFDKTLQAMKEVQAESLKEAIKLQGEEIKSVTSQLYTERSELRSRVANEKSQLRVQWQEKARKMRSMEEERLAIQLRKQLRQEGNEVLRGLAEEADKERSDLRKTLESEIECLRRDRQATLRRDEIQNLNERLKCSHTQVHELRLRLDSIREDIKLSATDHSRLKTDASQLLEDVASTQRALDTFADEEEIVIGDPRVTALSENLSKTMNLLSTLRAEKNAVLIEFTEELQRLQSNQKVFFYE